MPRSYGTFAERIDRWVSDTTDTIDTATRAIAIEMLTRMVLRSPVGNPELWAANRKVIEGRQRFNADVDAVSAFARNPLTRLRYDKVKTPRRLSARTIAKRLPLKAGRGYVGGRFRANWNLEFGRANRTTLAENIVDPSGQNAIASGIDHLTANYVRGQAIYITNSLPYGPRLEFGWSRQAPQGFVRVTVAEFSTIADTAAQAARAENT